MEDEFDYEVLEHLEHLTKITYSIKTVYDMLLFLEVNKTLLEDIAEKKNQAISSLVSLKILEDEEYDFFAEDYSRASMALDFLDENENDVMTHKDKLCFTRIFEKLSKIELINGLEQDYDGNIGEISKSKEFKFLLERGLTEEDAAMVYLDYSSILDSSISCRYASLLEDEIDKGGSSFLFLKLRLEEAFASPNDLEDALLQVKFNKLPRNLSEELKANYDLNQETLNEFIEIEMHDNLLDIVNKINNCKNKLELNSCIMFFKTYLLYIDKEELKKVTGLVEAWIQDKRISELLTKYINEADIIKKEQDIDSNTKELR